LLSTRRVIRSVARRYTHPVSYVELSDEVPSGAEYPGVWGIRREDPTIGGTEGSEFE